MKKLTWIMFIILTGNVIQAQTDSIFDAYNKEFEAFRKSVDNDFNRFKTQNDSAFLKFLEQTWKEFEIFRHAQPVRPKPKEQPIINEKSDTTQQELEYIVPLQPNVNVKKEQIVDSRLKELKPINFESRVVTKSFNIFGISAEIYYYPDKLPRLDIVNEKSITAFYRDLSYNSSIWIYNLIIFEKIKQSCHFNDWGYYNVLMRAAESIFNQKNEQILFIWYALVKSGYQVKVGFDNNTLYLLLPSQQELYNIQYLSENGLQFYLFQNGNTKPVQLKTYQGFYTDSAKIFSFTLTELPKINDVTTESRDLNYNQKNINLLFNRGIIDFLNSYPQCALNIYFGLPISVSNINILDKLFYPMFQGKTNREKVDILLGFIQNAIAYQSDQEQFGKERYMFAEECLYFPYSDCEDRSALLGQLVKHFTGLPAIGLEFHDHVTLAVHFPGEEQGTYILFEGEKYYVCDPTYINSKSGMLPNDLKNEKPQIILF